MKTDQSFGVVPVLKNDPSPARFLLVHQTAGHWAFPKGHPEPGESHYDSARRELREETGIDNVTILDGYQHNMHYFIQKDGQDIEKQVTFFIGFVNDEPVSPKEDEVQDFRWCEYEEALTLLTYEDSKKLLREVQEKIA